MPSFDIVSKINPHELTNAVDQANREVGTRFDFKGSGASFFLNKDTIALKASQVFQLKQMIDILQSKLIKRGIDIKALEYQKAEESLHEAKQNVLIKQGINHELAKKINQIIKNQQLKVQTSIQGEQIRVAGKKKDDLQEVIQLLRKQNLELPVQFENFRD